MEEEAIPLVQGEESPVQAKPILFQDCRVFQGAIPEDREPQRRDPALLVKKDDGHAAVDPVRIGEGGHISQTVSGFRQGLYGQDGGQERASGFARIHREGERHFS